MPSVAVLALKHVIVAYSRIVLGFLWLKSACDIHKDVLSLQVLGHLLYVPKPYSPINMRS